MRRVVIASPFRGLTPMLQAQNIRYVRAALRDSLLRDEAPFASHALYTLPGVLDDKIAAERAAGMAAGLAWSKGADVTLFYSDLGSSSGVESDLAHAQECSRPIEHRRLPADWDHNDALDDVILRLRCLERDSALLAGDRSAIAHAIRVLVARDR